MKRVAVDDLLDAFLRLPWVVLDELVLMLYSLSESHVDRECARESLERDSSEDDSVEGVDDPSDGSSGFPLASSSGRYSEAEEADESSSPSSFCMVACFSGTVSASSNS